MTANCALARDHRHCAQAAGRRAGRSEQGSDAHLSNYALTEWSPPLKRIPTRPSVRAATSWPKSQRSPQLGLLNSEKTPQHCLLGVCFGFDQSLDISDHRKFAYLSVSAGGDDRRRHGRVPRPAEGGARQDGQAACAAAGGRGEVRQRVSDAEPGRKAKR